MLDLFWIFFKITLAVYAFWLLIILIQLFYQYRSQFNGRLYAVKKRWFHRFTRKG